MIGIAEMRTSGGVPLRVVFENPTTLAPGDDAPDPSET